MHIRFEPYDQIKLLQYLLFSSLSVLAGYSLTNSYIGLADSMHVISLLPILYSFNYIYSQVYRSFAKKALPYFTWIKEQNRENIIHSHALLINLLLIYFIFHFMFSLNLRHTYTATVQTSILVFTVLYFLHRLLKDMKSDQSRLISLLKYKSHEHVHVFAATVVGLPFLIGLALLKKNYTVFEIAHSAILTYGIYMMSWAVFYQHKYKRDNFLKDYRYLIPSVFYPALPIFFFFCYDYNISIFYGFFIIMCLLYLFPIFEFVLNFKPSLFRLLNEKLLLSAILILLIISNWYPFEAYQSQDLSEFKIFIPNLVIAVFGLYLSKKHLNEYYHYLNFYAFVPFFSINFIHMILWILHDYFIKDEIIINSMRLISKHLTTIEYVYPMIYLAFVLLSFFKRNKLGKNL